MYIFRKIKPPFYSLVLCCGILFDSILGSSAVFLQVAGTIRPAQSFQKAKLTMAEIYRDLPTSFYCGCTLNLPKVEISTCGIKQELSIPGLTADVEYEHVVPASLFKKSLLVHSQTQVLKQSCVRKSRRCIKSSELAFSTLEGDLHNLRPVVANLNRIRGNKDAGLIDRYHKKNGCGFKMNKDLFEPPDNVKGDVARIYLYIHHKYPSLKLVSRKKQKLYLKWHLNDPVSVMEKKINSRIKNIQGDSNIFVETPSKMSQTMKSSDRM